MTKKILLSLLVLLVSTSTSYLLAFNKKTPTFNHFTYPYGKYKALIMSFDDGCITDLKLVTLFNKYHITGTFNISSSFMGTTQIWSVKNGDTTRQTYIKENQIVKIYKNHEIAVHGASHRNFLKISPEAVLEEVNTDIQKLSQLTHRKINSLAYPFGSSNNAIAQLIASTGLSNARTVKESLNFELADNFFLWNPTCRDDKALDFSDSYLNLREKKLSVFYIWGHSWELENEKRWNNMVGFCKIISNKKDIWYTGSGNLANYLNALKKVTIGANEITNPKDNLPVWLNLSSGTIVLKPGHHIKITKLNY